MPPEEATTDGDGITRTHSSPPPNPPSNNPDAQHRVPSRAEIAAINAHPVRPRMSGDDLRNSDPLGDLGIPPYQGPHMSGDAFRYSNPLDDLGFPPAPDQSGISSAELRNHSALEIFKMRLAASQPPLSNTTTQEANTQPQSYEPFPAAIPTSTSEPLQDIAERLRLESSPAESTPQSFGPPSARADALWRPMVHSLPPASQAIVAPNLAYTSPYTQQPSTGTEQVLPEVRQQQRIEQQSRSLPYRHTSTHANAVSPYIEVPQPGFNRPFVANPAEVASITPVEIPLVGAPHVSGTGQPRPECHRIIAIRGLDIDRCSIAFRDLQALLRHAAREHHAEECDGKLVCTIRDHTSCSQGFDSWDDFEYHQILQHPELYRQDPFVCQKLRRVGVSTGVCYERFDTAEALARHEAEEHSSVEIPRDNREHLATQRPIVGVHGVSRDHHQPAQHSSVEPHGANLQHQPNQHSIADVLTRPCRYLLANGSWCGRRFNNQAEKEKHWTAGTEHPRSRNWRDRAKADSARFVPAPSAPAPSVPAPYRRLAPAPPTTGSLGMDFMVDGYEQTSRSRNQNTSPPRSTNRDQHQQPELMMQNLAPFGFQAEQRQHQSLLPQPPQPSRVYQQYQHRIEDRRETQRQTHQPLMSEPLPLQPQPDNDMPNYDPSPGTGLDNRRRESAVSGIHAEQTNDIAESSNQGPGNGESEGVSKEVEVIDLTVSE